MDTKKILRTSWNANEVLYLIFMGYYIISYASDKNYQYITLILKIVLSILFLSLAVKISITKSRVGKLYYILNNTGFSSNFLEIFAALFALISLVSSINNITRKYSLSFMDTNEAINLFYIIAALILLVVSGISKNKITEFGILNKNILIRWEDIRAWNWDKSINYILSLEVSHRNILGRTCISRKIKTQVEIYIDDKDKVDKYLHNYVNIYVKESK